MLLVENRCNCLKIFWWLCLEGGERVNLIQDSCSNESMFDKYKTGSLMMFPKFDY